VNFSIENIQPSELVGNHITFDGETRALIEGPRVKLFRPLRDRDGACSFAVAIGWCAVMGEA
jgi:hypothetical protein